MPELAAPVFTALLGAVLFGLSLTQPAWLDGRIGPGLFARWLSAAVVVMSMIWFVVVLFEARAAGQGHHAGAEAPSLLPGLGLLAGVALFALTLPFTGLVAACGLTAVVVSWGAGERGWISYLISGLSGAGAALLLGLTLLPPGTRLWPPGV